jgi:hypothetical protein
LYGFPHFFELQGEEARTTTQKHPRETWAKPASFGRIEVEALKKRLG